MTTLSLYNIQAEPPVRVAALDIGQGLTYLEPATDSVLKTKGIAIPQFEQIGEFAGVEKVRRSDPLFAKAFVAVYWKFQLHHDIYVWKDEKGETIEDPVSIVCKKNKLPFQSGGRTHT